MLEGVGSVVGVSGPTYVVRGDQRSMSETEVILTKWYDYGPRQILSFSVRTVGRGKEVTEG